jgi:CheY-like chemotaxis protein
MNKHTILWADDDIDDLEIFRVVLHDLTADYEVKEFLSGKGVLNYLKDLDKKALPCLIILDMNMPVLNGRDTLAILKKDPEYQNIPVVVFTTSTSEMDRMYCARFNTEMLTKPITYGELKEVVQNLLTHCHQ